MGLLSALVFLPLVTAIIIICLPRAFQPRWIALIGMSLHLLLTSIMTFKFLNVASMDKSDFGGVTKLYLVEKIPWFENLGIEYFLGVDGISVSLLVLTSIVIFTGVLASWQLQERAKEFFAFLLVLVTGVFGVFVSFDLFLFFIFYEVAVLPMYLLIGVWGTGAKTYSAMKLTLMLMVGSAFLLVAILAIYHHPHMKTFDLIKLGQVYFDPQFQQWVFPLLFFGFGVLGALFPFHTWSPDGHASAPTAVSMLHAGVLMKLGGYGILRVALYLFPTAAIQWALFFMVLATINIVYGAFGAIKQNDLKYFTAYSSVSHCGFVIFGFATLNLMGFKGAVIQMFSHGIMTALFFSLIGMVYGRTHTRMISELGGLAKALPWFATCFYIGGFASLGLPGLSGFVAESHIFLGGFLGNTWYHKTFVQILTLLATTSIVITAVYVLRGLAQVFHGPLLHFDHLPKVLLTEKIATGFLVLTLIFVGVAPSYLSDLIEKPLRPFIVRISQVVK